MIDPDKLPDQAVDAALAHYVTGSTVSIRDSIAAFLNAWLDDDEAMIRGGRSVASGPNWFRVAVERAVQINKEN